MNRWLLAGSSNDEVGIWRAQVESTQAGTWAVQIDRVKVATQACGPADKDVHSPNTLVSNWLRESRMVFDMDRLIFIILSPLLV